MPRPRSASTTAGSIETGDLAELADDGVVSILGRADDMLIVGGFNVQPAEIEDALSNASSDPRCGGLRCPAQRSR